MAAAADVAVVEEGAENVEREVNVGVKEVNVEVDEAVARVKDEEETNVAVEE